MLRQEIARALERVDPELGEAKALWGFLLETLSPVPGPAPRLPT
jgi:hypothetical protein